MTLRPMARPHGVDLIYSIYDIGNTNTEAEQIPWGEGGLQGCSIASRYLS